MSRRLVVKQRISLAPYSEGWDDCYLIFSAFTKGDYDEIRNVQQDLPDDEAESFMVKHLTFHFVSGRVLVTDDADVETLSDAEASDISDLPRTVKIALFSDLATGGAQYRNPKA